MNSFPGGAPLAGGALGPAEREASLAVLKASTGARQGTRHPDRRRRHCRRRRRPRCRDPRPERGHRRGQRLGGRHVVAVLEAHPRRPAVPGDAGLRPGQGGAARARADPLRPRPAPCPARPVPLPAHQAVRGTALRRLRHRPLRRHVHHRRPQPRRPVPQAPEPARHPAGGAEPQGRRLRRVHPLLRRPGRRREVRRQPRAHRGLLRRARGEPDGGGGLPARGRTGGRRQGGQPRGRLQLQHPGQAGHQRHRRLDRRDPGHGHRPRPAQGPRLQGHPPGGAAGPLPVHGGPDPADREVRAVRHSRGAGTGSSAPPTPTGTWTRPTRRPPARTSTTSSSTSTRSSSGR